MNAEWIARCETAGREEQQQRHVGRRSRSVQQRSSFSAPVHAWTSHRVKLPNKPTSCASLPQSTAQHPPILPFAKDPPLRKPAIPL
jgi:hypothetical protein